MNRACTLGDLGHGRMGGTEQSVDSRTIALLEEPPEIQEMLSRDNISPRHVRALHTIGNESERTALAQQAASKHWSVEETEQRARRAATGGRPRTGELVPERSSLWEVLRHVTDVLRMVTMLQRLVKQLVAWVKGLMSGRPPAFRSCRKLPRGNLRQLASRTVSEQSLHSG